MAYFAEVLDAVRHGGSKLLYAEDFVYFDGVKGLTELLIEAQTHGQGQDPVSARRLRPSGLARRRLRHAGAVGRRGAVQQGVPSAGAVPVPEAGRGHPARRPADSARGVSAVALQVLKHQPPPAGEHFRVMQNVDDFGRITVVFDDLTVAEVIGHDLSISGIRNELSVIADFGQYDLRVNPNNEHELFLPDGRAAGNLLFREKLPTPQGTSFPRPNQFHAHGYVNEINDAVDCALEPTRGRNRAPLLAWDTLAVLMAGYESSAAGGGFVDLQEYTHGRQFRVR